jgi:hypothetical protein
VVGLEFLASAGTAGTAVPLVFLVSVDILAPLALAARVEPLATAVLLERVVILAGQAIQA